MYLKKLWGAREPSHLSFSRLALTTDSHSQSERRGEVVALYHDRLRAERARAAGTAATEPHMSGLHRVVVCRVALVDARRAHCRCQPKTEHRALPLKKYVFLVLSKSAERRSPGAAHPPQSLFKATFMSLTS